MRHTDRSLIPTPIELIGAEAQEARREVDTVLALDEASRSTRRVKIREHLFLQTSVRRELRALFFDKCAYCETLLRGDEGTVEHFRPMSNAWPYERTASAPHHYAWLAYDWRNLYLACNACVRKKSNQFPVEGHRAPLLSSLEEIREAERALLLDPDYDWPHKHIDFDLSGTAEGKTDKGSTTIDVLDLNRPELVTLRSRHLAALEQALQNSTLTPDVSNILFLLSPEAPFSGVASIVLNKFAAAIARRLGARKPSFRNTSSALAKLLPSADEAIVRSSLEDLVRHDEPTVEQLEHPPVAWVGRVQQSDAYVPVLRADPGHIRRIEIQNFKAIKHLAFGLPEFRAGSSKDASSLMLLGENASGKSSVLEAIALTLVGPEQARRLKVVPSDFLRRRDRVRWQLADPHPANVRIEFHGDYPPAELRIDPMTPEFSGAGSPNVILAYGARRYFTKARRNRRSARSERVRGLFDATATIAHPELWLKSLSESTFSAVARALREILILRQEDELERDEQLGICVRAYGQLTPLERLSEGYKSLFAMSVDAMRGLLDGAFDLETASGVILVDEIETHLHPRWKMRVMTALRAAMPRVQFVATTHDPLCLRGMEDGEVQVLVRDVEQDISTLPDLPSVKGLTAEQLLTSDYFGLNSTADPEVEVAIARLADGLQRPGEDVDEIQAKLLSTITLGDTPENQVVAEAMSKYLESRRSGSAAERSGARKEVVAAFLERLAQEAEGD